MRQITRTALGSMAIAVTAGTICASMASLAMDSADTIYPGAGIAVGISIILIIVGSIVLALERGWLD